MTFEPRHENKTSSACPEDQLKPFNFFKNFKFLKFSNFQIFKNFPGYQLLSDFQTFFLSQYIEHRCTAVLSAM